MPWRQRWELFDSLTGDSIPNPTEANNMTVSVDGAAYGLHVTDWTRSEVVEYLRPLLASAEPLDGAPPVRPARGEPARFTTTPAPAAAPAPGSKAEPEPEPEPERPEIGLEDVARDLLSQNHSPSHVAAATDLPLARVRELQRHVRNGEAA